MGLPSTCASNLIGAKDTMSEQKGSNGGGEGSRTPVLETFRASVYMFSGQLVIRDLNLCPPVPVP
jgi:hypothetical protein